MAYEIISQNNNTTTLSDGTNTITVPGHVTLATSTSYTITEVNNNTATLEGGDGSVIRDVPCIAVLAGGGSSDTHNKGFFATQAALEEAYPTGEAGDYAIVGATDTVWVWDTDTSAWVDTDQKGQVVSVNSKTGTVVLDAIDVSAVPEYSSMPQASVDNANQIVLYSGATNGTYTKGYFYQNKVSSTQSSATISQIEGNSLSDLAVNKSTFEQMVSLTTGNYRFIFDGTNWEYDSTEVNLTDYGISYTGTPVADDAIMVAYSAPTFLYYWERIDVQPAQVNSDWNANSGVAQILNKPTIPDAIQVSSMPTAGADELGKVYQFIGTTDANYTHGYFYECVSDGQNPATYSWTQTDVQPQAGGLPSQTGNAGKFLTTDGTDASWGKALTNNTTTYNSISIGDGGSASGSNAVTLGYWAQTNSSETVAVGANSFASSQGVAVGYNAKADTHCVVIGQFNSAPSVGVGCVLINGSQGSKGDYSVVIGYAASSGNGTSSAHMIGTGANTESNTLRVGFLGVDSYKLLDSDGTIPTDRFTTTPVADGTYVPTLTISSGTATRSWTTPASAPVVPATAPTLAVADWSSNTQTITVSGVMSSNVVLVGPAPSSAQDYADAGIICTAQGTDSLTFTCTTVPSNAITLSVVIFG